MCQYVCVGANLSGVDSLVDNLEYEVGPDDVQDQQRRQQRVEDVVRGEHLHDLRGLYRRAVVVGRDI